jgi:hypothetical protein
LKQPWVYGKISREEAQRILCQNITVPGHFLLRQSNTMASAWALSLLTAANDPEPEHHVLQPDSRGVYTINGTLGFCVCVCVCVRVCLVWEGG